jgi:hypothetical protein
MTITRKQMLDHLESRMNPRRYAEGGRVESKGALRRYGEGAMDGLRRFSNAIDPFQFITPRDIASMAPGGGLVEAATQDYPAAREAFGEGRYLDAAGRGAAGALNQVSDVLAVAGAPGVAAGAALRGGVKAGKAAAGASRLTQIPDIRSLPADEATRIARREPHLIPGGDRTEGYYVGGPRDIKSRKDLLRMRRDLDKFIDQNPQGGDWYDRYRASVTESTGGNPADNDWATRMQGQWSAGVSPEGELGFTLKELNSALLGKPVKAGRPASHEAFQQAIATNNPKLLARGKKTGKYARQINPDLNPIPTATGVNDFRHQRNLGYTNPDGSLPSSGNHMVGDATHTFMDYETALAVHRANQRGLAGRSNWTGEQIQAAPWVHQKAQDLQLRGGTNKDGSFKLSYDEAFARANTEIGDFYPKHTANATHEQLPGSTTGHLPGLQAADQATKDAYSADPRSLWSNAPGGRDALYASVRHPDAPNVGMRVLPTTDMQGVYTNPQGVTETNLGQVARPLVAFDASGGGAGNRRMAAADREILETGELTRAYIDAQNAGAAHVNIFKNKAGDMGSAFVPLDRQMTPDEALRLRQIGAAYGMDDIVDTGRGATMTRFYPSPPDPNVVGPALRQKGALSRDIAEAIPGAGAPRRTYTDGVYADLTEEWAAGSGSGRATQKLLDRLDANPVLREGLDRSESIPRNALARMERDYEVAGATGDILREDIQNARRIIGEGPGWITRLREGLSSGQILPAVALPILAAAGLRSGEEGDL